MKLSVRRHNNTLYPVGEIAHEDIYRLNNTEEYVCNITLKRNHRFHRLAFALFSVIFDSQDFFTDPDVFRKYLIKQAGRVIIVETPKGIEFWPESISYENMEQDEFEKLFQAIITFAVKEYGQDADTLHKILDFA